MFAFGELSKLKSLYTEFFDNLIAAGADGGILGPASRPNLRSRLEEVRDWWEVAPAPLES